MNNKTSRQILREVTKPKKVIKPIYFLIFFLVIAVILAIWFGSKISVPFVLIVSTLAIISIIEGKRRRKYFENLSIERGKLSVTDFQNQFNAREISPIVIRYVYQCLEELDIKGNVRAEDDIYKVCKFEEEDLEDIILNFMCDLSIPIGVLDDVQPTKIRKIGDLVNFINQIHDANELNHEIDPKIICSIAKKQIPDEFKPKYIFHTRIHATSLVKKIWLFDSFGNWNEIESVENSLNDEKIKYFSTESEIVIIALIPKTRKHWNFKIKRSELVS